VANTVLYGIGLLIFCSAFKYQCFVANTFMMVYWFFMLVGIANSFQVEIKSVIYVIEFASNKGCNFLFFNVILR
jgi:hypothetical protein